VSRTVILLLGAPDFAPGILFKMFQDIEGVGSYFQPFTRHLDLISKYSLTLRAEYGIPPGYFDSYQKIPDLFKNYPKIDAEISFSMIRPFLMNCADSARDYVVFEMSHSENLLSQALELWPNAKVVTLRDIPGQKFEKDSRKKVTHEELVQEYSGSAKNILEFCGITHYSDQNLSFTSDWLKLNYTLDGIEVRTAKPYVGLSLSRDGLEKLLRQRSALLELAKLELQVNSLKSQLESVHQVAEQRLAIIHELDSALKEQRARVPKSNRALSFFRNPFKS
jgi:hypothetical protein